MPVLSPTERELELRFCEIVLKELTAPKHSYLNEYIIGPNSRKMGASALPVSPSCSDIQQRLSDRNFDGLTDFENAINAMFKDWHKEILLLRDSSEKKMASIHRDLKAIFTKKWAERHSWVTARLASPTPRPVRERSVPNNRKSYDPASEKVTPAKRSATNAGLDNAGNLSKTGRNSKTDQAATKKLCRGEETPPLTNAKCVILDKVFVKHLHESLAGYMFTIQSSTYDSAAQQWCYTLFNKEVIGWGQTLSVPEKDIIKPAYRKGSTFQLPRVPGKMVIEIKDVRLVKGKVEYETAMLADPQTYTAEEMVDLLKLRN